MEQGPAITVPDYGKELKNTLEIDKLQKKPFRALVWQREAQGLQKEFRFAPIKGLSPLNNPQSLKG